MRNKEMQLKIIRKANYYKEKYVLLKIIKVLYVKY